MYTEVYIRDLKQFYFVHWSTHPARNLMHLFIPVYIRYENDDKSTPFFLFIFFYSYSSIVGGLVGGFFEHLDSSADGDFVLPEDEKSLSSDEESRAEVSYSLLIFFFS